MVPENGLRIEEYFVFGKVFLFCYAGKKMDIDGQDNIDAESIGQSRGKSELLSGDYSKAKS